MPPLDASQSRTVLVVDDSRMTRRFISKAVTMAGFPPESIHEAGNGQEALAILQQHAIDLVITDLVMPELDGYGLIETMSADDAMKNIPVIIISGTGQQKNLDRIHVKGVVRYLRKPITPENLSKVLHQTMGAQA